MMTQTETIRLTRQDIESLPNYRKRTPKEWSSGCPICGGDPSKDTDRFRFWPDVGNFWCRKCGLSGFVDAGSYFEITPEMRERWDADRQAREDDEKRRTETALNRLQKKRNDNVYHEQLMSNDEQIEAIRQRWGLLPITLLDYNIGYCFACPTSPYSTSYTIPFYKRSHLINIRHRLLAPNGQGKYRPEFAGLPTALFNIDILRNHNERVFVFEGEIKAVYMAQMGIVGVGLSGKSQFQPDWARYFQKARAVYICLDPDAEKEAIKVALFLRKENIKTRIMSLPVKVDDMFHLRGGKLRDFEDYVQKARSL